MRVVGGEVRIKDKAWNLCMKPREVGCVLNEYFALAFSMVDSG